MNFTRAIRALSRRYLGAFASVLTLWCSCSLAAEKPQITHLYLNDAWVADDPRLAYKLTVLTEALETTVAEFGPYEIHFRETIIQNQRVVQRIEAGGAENVFFGLTSKELEQRLIPIRVPIRMGVHNYRLLLIHKDDQDKFAQVETIDQLKQLRFGVGAHWMMRKVVESQGFNTVPSNTYEGLFKMLEQKRFDYTARGPHEVFTEINRFADEAPNIMIEPTLALHNVAPFYFFVSRHEPQIAQRMTAGLTQLSKTGRLRQLFMKFNGQYVQLAEIEKRRIIHIPNQMLSKETPLQKGELWIWPESIYGGSQ